MNSCHRYEQEALLALEQGRKLPAHFSSCPDCLRAQATYAELTEALGDLAEDVAPQPGWQARVLATTKKRSAWRPWLWVGAPLAAVVAGAAFLVFTPGIWGPPPARIPALMTSLRSGTDAVRRGQEAKPGDVLILRAFVGGFSQAELRVYFNDREAVLRCAEEAPCQRRGEMLEAELSLDSIGMYQPALFLSDLPLTITGEGLDADAGEVLASGGRVELGDTLDVR